LKAINKKESMLHKTATASTVSSTVFLKMIKQTVIILSALLFLISTSFAIKP
jgi:hypothetical protein